MRYWIAPHLAFLVQWLRVLGVDVRLWNKGVILEREDETIIQWNRYPLPLQHAGIRILSLSASTLETLLKEFFEISSLRPDLSQMFKRCLRCNTPLIRLTPGEALRHRRDIPAYVLATQKRFNWCEQCRKAYWAGTHVRNMIRALEDWGIITSSDVLANY